ncbi:MAG TPA: condensation domain-containing protein [Polyangiaceae bacterium]|nr:condensation domain-containing protein [Polyangiaceae bacterium]
MNLDELLHELQRREIELRADGERLRVSAAPGQLTPELKEHIRTFKPDLLKILTPKVPPSTRTPSESGAGGRETYPLSPAQSRQAAAGRASVALPLVLRLTGPLHVPALKSAIELIVERHAPLRSRFFVNAERPYQEVLKNVSVVLTSVDMVADSEARALNFLAGEMSLSLDLSLPPVGRFHLLRINGARHIFCAAFSPLVIDGWSQQVFLQELRIAYAALAGGHAPRLPKLELDYADLADWQSDHLADRQNTLAKFWNERFAKRLPPLPLPTDRQRPKRSTNNGSGFHLELDERLTKQIRETASAAGCTTQMLLLAAYYVFLARLSGNRDLVIATPAAARLHPKSEPLIGAFVNVLLLRFDFDLEVPFTQLVQRVRDYCLDAYEHQEFPMDQLRVRSIGSSDRGFAPAFQVEFSYQHVAAPQEAMRDVQIEVLELLSGSVSSELSLLVKDSSAGISAVVEYKTDLFSFETVKHWFECFRTLLQNLTASPNANAAAVVLVEQERSSIEAKLRAVIANGEPLPFWLASELGVSDWNDVESISIEEPNGQPLPLGCYGTMRVSLKAAPNKLVTSSLLRLTHGGTLQQKHKLKAELGSRYERPATDTEIQIASLFEELLGEDVGATGDYFEFGGNSLMAVTLFKEIQRRFGVTLPFTTILTAPTPRLLAAQVRAGGPPSQGSLLVLKQGSRREKLFLVHDGDGEVLLYRNLARRLPAELSVLGLQPRIDGGLLTDVTMADIATHYVHEIRGAQPEGPYLIGGLCAGGLIAFEISRQLKATGEQVGLLLLLDAAPPHARNRNGAIERWRRFSSVTSKLAADPVTIVDVMREASGKIVGFLDHAARSTMHKTSAKLRVEMLRRWPREQMSWPRWVPAPTFRELFERMEQDYAGEAVSIPSLLVRASHGKDGDIASRQQLIDPHFDWQTLIRGEIQVVDVPGGHSTMLREPHVDATARAVSSVLRGVLDRPA